MAYDKIIPIRRRMVRCINYVLDEDKTDLANALNYTENPIKTQRLVTGINCAPETALEEMNATKRRWDKKGGVLGYHIIHSYAPGEVTPEEAHAAGVEFAERLLGDKYEVVVSTHLDREHLHCHIVFNSVSFVDGAKYRDNFKSYFEDLRGTSNEVSKERGLSVIEPDGHGKHYAEWSAEQIGKGTIRGLVRQDIDAAIAESFTFDTFLAALRRQGYTIKYAANVKHTAIRPPGGARFLRLDGMGAGYTEADIRERITAARNGEAYEMPPSAPEPPAPPMLTMPRTHKRYTVRRGTIPTTPRPKIRGFRALYLRYVYLLRGYRRPQRRLPPFAVRKEVTKLQRYNEQFRFLMQYRIDTDKQLSMLGDALQDQIDLLVDYRKELYKERRGGRDVEAELANINRKLRSTRRELTICRHITEDIPKIRDQERLMREQEQHDKNAARERTGEYVRKESKGKWM
ncbi:MAG: relaxase/mobilization nuclease domain-containing protein [Oscillospiraceae bacterium]|nr:relaxase/mobilization nuclease domain-containing protein [Clostridia bacterium]MBR0312693.1 relaxase/mobilization nuclease domain-containing protein [Oscillospiraceae bacterium]